MTALTVSPTRWSIPAALRVPAQALWSELRFARAPNYELDLLLTAARHCSDPRFDPRNTMRRLGTLLFRWADAGFVDVFDGKPPQYAMKEGCRTMSTPPLLPAPTRRSPFPHRTQRQRLWSAMRVLRQFDLVTLAIAAEVRQSTARDMISVLTRAGFLRRTETGWSTAATRRWGPIAPSWTPVASGELRVIRVTDQRDGTIVDLPIRGARGPSHPNDSAHAQADGGRINHV